MSLGARHDGLDHDSENDEFNSITNSLPEHVWVRLSGRSKIRQRLRVSLVDNCNFRCFFCHNEGQGPILNKRHLSLSSDELASIVTVAAREGVKYVKLTGGEPLLFGKPPFGIVELIERLDSIRRSRDGVSFDLSMTTNGSLLARVAHLLRVAGLDRVTVSLTTQDLRTFDTLIATQQALLLRSLEGLRAAAEAGLRPLKVNTVVYQSRKTGLGNLDELFSLMAAARTLGVDELRIFTLLWHESFHDFEDYYHFFSAEMINALCAALRQLDVPDPDATVEVLAMLGTLFADSAYPKVEFGVSTSSMRIGFEAMKFGRLDGASESQEGPYAIRLGADGGVRVALNSAPSYDLIGAIRCGTRGEEAGHLYRKALGEML